MLQSHLRNDLGRAGETESACVERYVIEGRVVNFGVEIAPYVPASCMVFLPEPVSKICRKPRNPLSIPRHAFVPIRELLSKDHKDRALIRVVRKAMLKMLRNLGVQQLCGRAPTGVGPKFAAHGRVR